LSQAKLGIPIRNEERITYTLLGDPALRVGIAPPVMAVTINGMSWDGSVGAEYVSDREDDSLTVRIGLRDESHVDPPQIKDFVAGLYDWVPDSLLKVVGLPPDDRRLTVEYRTQLVRQPYSILIRAADEAGSYREIALPIPMTVGFFEDVGDALIPLGEGAILADSSRLAITVRTGCHLSPGRDLTLLARGTALTLRDSALVADPGEPFLHTLRYEALAGLPPGPLDLAMQVAQRGGELVTLAEQEVEIGAEVLYFRDWFWIPSPFSEQATLIYDLSLPGDRVRLRIFTASGRCILTEENLPALRGIQQRPFVWHGQDADGDAVANGLYFYELTLWGDDGKIAGHVVDKLIRAR
jgi:hypothetical protein